MPTASYTPTNEEQELLELLNRARANPVGEYEALIANAATLTGSSPGITNAIRYFGVDPASYYAQIADDPPVAPLAWNADLAEAAEYHNGVMIAGDEQSHQLDGEPGLISRMQAAGYSNIRRGGENIYAYSFDALYGHAGFFIDWGYDAVDYDSEGNLKSDFDELGDGIQDAYGHRVNMLSPNYTEVGIAMVAENNPGTEVGPNLITQDFGDRWTYDPQILGVVLQDLDGDRFYDAGEGLGGVLVTAVRGSSVYTTSTWSSGGYQMVLPDGDYLVTFSGGSLTGEYQVAVTMDGENVKVDAFYADTTPPTPTGNETLTGGSLADSLRGRDGHDNLSGFGGNDTLDGGQGNDTILGGTGDDLIFDGFGVNQIQGEGGSDRIALLGGVNSVNGGGDSDFISGGFQADELKGGAGDDVIAGDPGVGMGGSDVLFGGEGDDTLMGGAGPDVFVFKPAEGDDVIGRFALASVTKGAGYSVSVSGADFKPGYDKVELREFTLVTAGTVESFLSEVGGNTVFEAEGTRITVIGVTGLEAGDFLFS